MKHYNTGQVLSSDLTSNYTMRHYRLYSDNLKSLMIGCVPYCGVLPYSQT